jgi:hypothetical protein
MALYPQGKMNIGEVDPLVAAKRCFRANPRCGVAAARHQSGTRCPDGRSRLAVKFLRFPDVSVELPVGRIGAQSHFERTVQTLPFLVCSSSNRLGWGFRKRPR